MLIRGFKARCENISLQIRKELNLGKVDPLFPQVLANHLKVFLWEPGNIRGLSKESLSILLGKEKSSWSALTVSFAGIDAIIYNSFHSLARQSSDIMHEMSHIILDHEPTKMVFLHNGSTALRSYNEAHEDEANWLSGCLLLPRDALLFIRKNGIDTDEACTKYRVSRELLDYRMNLSGVNYQLKNRQY
jgi:hypothetical protein